MLTYVYQFLDALLFSCFVESIVILVLCCVYKINKRIVLLAGIGTLLTIPYVWFVFPTLFWYSSTLALYLAESFAFLVEVGVYVWLGKLSWKHAMIFSFLANSASYLLGKII
jgi:hypothetical protein